MFADSFDRFLTEYKKGDVVWYVERMRDLVRSAPDPCPSSRTFLLDMADVRLYDQDLYDMIINQPLRYIPMIEFICRDLYVLQSVLHYKRLPQDLYNQLFLEQPDNQRTSDVIEALEKKELSLAMTEDESTSLAGPLNASSGSLRSTYPFIFVEVQHTTCITPLRKFSSNLIDHIICTKGIVIQASRPLIRAHRIVLQCKYCQHTKSIQVPLWRTGYNLPRQCEGSGAPDQGGGGTGGTSCPLDPYAVVSELCSYVDLQKIKLQELNDDTPTGEIPKHLSVHVTAGLVGKVSPGQRIYVTGIFSTVEQNQTQPYLHALGFQNIGDTLGGGMLMANSTSDLEEFHKLANNPKIKEMITQSIAPAVHGLEDVKLTLACQLFGGCRRVLGDGSSIRGDIHILLLGDPSTAKSQLLKFVEKISPVSVYTSGKGSSAAGLTAALIRDASGCFALEGGAMVLADGGIVCIDEFDKMRDTDRVSIHEAMEQQTISIAKAGITCILATECAVLAAANPTFGSFDETKDASEQHNFETTILSRFDAVWLVRDKRNRQLDEQIASHIFKLHGGGTVGVAEGPIEPLLLKKFLYYCRNTCHPTLTISAAKMLETFYVNVREEVRQRRTGGTGSGGEIPITVRQLESITRVAEALAKMELQATVNERHVVEAIRLFKASTVATNSSTVMNMVSADGPEDQQACENCQRTLLDRFALNSVCSKSTIVNDLKLRGFTSHVIGLTLSACVQKGILVERPNGKMKRINLGTC